jgi:hypothetical protein
MLNIIKIYIKSVKTPKKILDPDNCTPKMFTCTVRWARPKYKDIYKFAYVGATSQMGERSIHALDYIDTENISIL